MALRHCDLAASAEAATEHDTCFIEVLPPALMQRIFLMLPADAKARAACVRRGWRHVLADPELWTRLDLTENRWMYSSRKCAALRAAAARAQGRLQYLDVSDVDDEYSLVSVLEELLPANASLRQLRVLRVGIDGMTSSDRPCLLSGILAAAPQLQTVEVKGSVFVEWHHALLLMRAAPPLAQLRLCELCVYFAGVDVSPHVVDAFDRVNSFATLLTDVSLQPTLTKLTVDGAHTALPEVLDALVDAALARRQLRDLSFSSCTPPAPAPLARLLRCGSLTKLRFAMSFGGVPLFDAIGAELVADELRANTTLTDLTLCFTHVFHNLEAARTLIGALVGHPSLRALKLWADDAPPAASGASLAALIAADAPTLQSLAVSCYVLSFYTLAGDDFLLPLILALPGNHHLRRLDICDCGMSERFAEEQLLPAVRANTGLRELIISERWSAALEAQALVKSRA